MGLMLRHFLNNLILLVILAVPVILMVVPVLALSKRAKKDKMGRAWIIIPVVMVGIFASLFFLLVVFNSSGFIRFITLGALAIATVISIIVAVFQGFRHRSEFTPDNKKLYWLGAVLVFISTIIGFLVSTLATGQCERLHVASGNTVVSAIEKYHAQNNQYPKELTDLQPNYIDSSSIHTCYFWSWKWGNSPYNELDAYYYKNCPGGTTQLSIPEMGSGQFHLFDMADKKWTVTNGDTLEVGGRTTRCQEGQ